MKFVRASVCDRTCALVRLRTQREARNQAIHIFPVFSYLILVLSINAGKFRWSWQRCICSIIRNVLLDLLIWDIKDTEKYLWVQKYTDSVETRDIRMITVAFWRLRGLESVFFTIGEQHLSTFNSLISAKVSYNAAILRDSGSDDVSGRVV